MESEEEWPFHRPASGHVLFHPGDYGEGDPEALWRLFRGTVQNSVALEDFKSALKIDWVGMQKLTQTMALINAHEFSPVNSLHDAGFGGDIGDGLQPGDWMRYRNAIEKVRGECPGMPLYEIHSRIEEFGVDFAR